MIVNVCMLMNMNEPNDGKFWLMNTRGWIKVDDSKCWLMNTDENRCRLMKYV